MEVWVEKYRPKKLDDIIGQDIVIKGLKSYVESKNLPNLLFSGPPGVGKCCKGNTLILTDRGLIKIEDIVHKKTDFSNRYIDHGQTNLYDIYDSDDNGFDEILKEEDNNIKNINNVVSISPKLNYEKYKIIDRYDMGENDIITIKTRIGLEISGTPEHKIVIIDNNGKLRFKKLQDISTSDHITVSYDTNIFNKTLKLNFFYRRKKGDNTSQTLKNIDYMNSDIAELLGYIIAEANDYGTYVRITNYDREIVDRVLKICKDINIEVDETYEDGKLVGADIGSIAFKEFAYYLGYRKLAQNKEVPWSILQADKDSQISFISALFDGDGTVGEYDGRPLVEYGSSSYELCRQLQIMLLNFGIIGRLSSKKGAKLKYKGEIREYEESYRLSMFGGEILKFAEIINFGLSRKKEILDKCVETLESKDRWTDITYPNIEKIISRLYEELKMLGQKGKIVKKWQEDFVIGNKTIKLDRQKAVSCKEYIKHHKGLMYHSLSGERQPSIYGLKHILSIMGPVSYLSEYKYLEIFSNQFIFDNVVIIKNEKARVYDVTIEDVHSYIGNSIINHNTATAISLVKELYGDMWRYNFIELNASDENGINVVRGKIKDFARSSTVGESEFKVIFLDESDALTPEAQAALRRTMENYTDICRFILSCNYSSKIIEPIQSRCSVYKFRRLPDDAIIQRVMYIAKEENVDISPGAINAIKYASQGDLRRAINALQSAAIIDKKIDADMIYKTSALAKPEDIDDLILLSLEGNFVKAHVKLNYLLNDEGLAGTDITGQIYRQIFNINIPDKLKIGLIDFIGEIDFRISEGSNERLQLGTLMSKFMLYGINKT